MNTLTIPKGLVQNDDLVVLTRAKYEELCYAYAQKQNTGNVTVKRSRSFKVKKGQEKFYANLDKDLTRTLREVKAGKVTDIFNTVEEAVEFLDSKK